MEEKAVVRVGFARVDVTPRESVPLAGYGNTSMRMSQNVLDALCVTCVAITDDAGDTVLLITADLTTVHTEVVDKVRKALEEDGIPQDHVILSATHTHSAPDLWNNAVPYIPKYREFLADGIIRGARLALADQKTAQMASGTINTHKMNFVRHYRMGDGTYAGDNFGSFKDSPIADYATPADPAMHLIRFQREGGKDVVLVNWRAHPHKTGGSKKYDVSADFVAPFRETVEKALDCHVAFFQGASGNINHSSRIPEDKTTTDYVLYGQQLAQVALEGLAQAKPGKLEKILTKQVICNGKTNRPDEETLANAKMIQEMWVSGNDRVACVAAGKPLGIRSPYHANAIVYRSTLSETLDLELNAIAIGDIAFLSAPNELFDSYCAEVTRKSPYRTTMILCLANGYRGYIPSKFGYEYTCYESDCSRFAPGTGELVADTFLETLKSLHERN